MEHAFVITIQQISWTMCIIFLELNRAALPGIGRQCGSSPHKVYTKNMERMSFACWYLIFTRYVVKNLGLSEKLLENLSLYWGSSRFHTLCNWRYNDILLPPSYFGGFEGFNLFDPPPSNISVIACGKISYSKLEHVLWFLRRYEVITKCLIYHCTDGGCSTIQLICTVSFFVLIVLISGLSMPFYAISW